MKQEKARPRASLPPRLSDSAVIEQVRVLPVEGAPPDLLEYAKKLDSKGGVIIGWPDGMTASIYNFNRKRPIPKKALVVVYRNARAAAEAAT